MRQNTCIRWGAGGGVKVRKAVFIQSVKVQVLCSGFRGVTESFTTPVGIAWMCGATVKYLNFIPINLVTCAANVIR